HAENSDHRDRAAADARYRAAIPATTATETARPMVPGGLDGERQLLRKGASRYSQERLVSGRLARERQTHGRQFWQRRTNVWRRLTKPARGGRRLRRRNRQRTGSDRAAPVPLGCA